MPLNSGEIRTELSNASVIQHRHVQLSEGGREFHSDFNVVLENLYDDRRALNIVNNSLNNLLVDQGLRSVAGASPEGEWLARVQRDQYKFGRVEPFRPTDDEVEIVEPDVSYLKSIGRVAILEGVVTADSGAVPLARAIKKVDSGIEISLVGVFRLGDISRRDAKLFSAESYLVERFFPLWPAEGCARCSAHPANRFTNRK